MTFHRGRVRAWTKTATAVLGALVVGLTLAVAGPALAGPGIFLTVTKSASPTTYTGAGQVIHYTYVIDETGTTDNEDAGGIELTDDKIGAVPCPSMTLVHATSMTCTADYTTTAADVTAGSVTNTATVTGVVSTDELDDVTTDSVTVTYLATPSWTLTKTPTPTTYTASGQTIGYSYVLTNTGDASISGITVTDDKVAPVTCAASTLAVGASTTCTGSYVTTASDVTAGSVANTAIAHGTPSGGSLTDATANATITLAAAPTWTLTKTASLTSYGAAGQSINYSYTLTNTGNVSISGITVSDDKVSPVTCPVATLAVGASTTCSGSYTTTASDVTAGSVTNHAFAHGTPSSGSLTDAVATATISFASAPAWTMSKTANPRTYSGSGERISYSYVIENTGNVSIGGIFVTDDKIQEVVCPSTDLAAGASMTCSASYITTEADVAAGSVTNTAAAHAGSTTRSAAPATRTARAVSGLANATATATITYKPPPTGSITITVAASGGNATFHFTSSNTAGNPFDLATSGGTASRAFADLLAGTYVFHQVDLPLHWALSSLACTGDKGGKATTVDLGSGEVSIGLDGGEAITCTFTDKFEEALHRELTQKVIAGFMGRRLRLMASDEPDRPRLARRSPGVLWGEGGAPFDFTGSSQDRSQSLSFATSLSRIAQAETQAESRAGGKDKASARAGGGALAKFIERGLDVWMEGHYNGFDNDEQLSEFGIVYVGADYLVTPSLLVGGLVQRDWMEETTWRALRGAKDAGPGRVKGHGLMAGPYVSARLAPNLFFDARTAWGASTNRINPFGLYTDTFSTDRWLVNARLTGNFPMGRFRITPSVTVHYAEDRQHGYTDSVGVYIPSQRAELGSVTFAPEIARRFPQPNGSDFELQASVGGVWNFKNPDATFLDGVDPGSRAFHARAQAGLMFHSRTGFTFRAVADYDGMGVPGFQSLGGRVWFSFPMK